MSTGGIKFKTNMFDVFVYAFCIIFAVFCFYPLWYIFIGSISPYNEFASARLKILPVGIPTFRYYVSIFSSMAFQEAIVVSIAKTSLGTFLMILITSSMAYGVSKKMSEE